MTKVDALKKQSDLKVTEIWHSSIWITLYDVHLNQTWKCYLHMNQLHGFALYLSMEVQSQLNCSAY